MRECRRSLLGVVLSCSPRLRKNGSSSFVGGYTFPSLRGQVRDALIPPAAPRGRPDDRRVAVGVRSSARLSPLRSSSQPRRSLCPISRWSAALCRGMRVLPRNGTGGAAGLDAPLPSGRMPAPPHDASGHTWHHRDDVLFRLVKEGVTAVVEAATKATCRVSPACSPTRRSGNSCLHQEHWPERQRGYQAAISAQDADPDRRTAL